MVDPTANLVIAQSDAADIIRMDQLDSAADTWYNKNCIALIKLRE